MSARACERARHPQVMYLGPRIRPVLAMVSLISQLKDFRAVTAAGLNIPVFCVFGDTVLKAIEAARPQDRQALLKIRGMTEDKCACYGEDVLRIVSRHRQPPPCPPPPCPPCPPDRGGTKRKFRPARLKEDVEDADGVYILELLHGRVYVGRTTDLRRRLHEHRSGKGSAFTKAFPPTGLLLPRLGRVSGSGEAAERDETLRYMHMRGAGNVRGWKYTRVELSPEDARDAEANIRELFDLCRRCGHPGHFMGECRNNYDRQGQPLA